MRTLLPNETYARHYKRWNSCVRCRIGTLATRHVFYRGSLPCDVLVIGEGPGKTENLKGLPFVGKAGQLLDKWLEPHDSLSFAVTNTVLCRPTDAIGGSNRAPTSLEVLNCKPRLAEFLEVARPRAVILAGKVAALNVSVSVPSLAVYHPAYVRRNGGAGSAMDREVRKKIDAFLYSTFVTNDPVDGLGLKAR